MSKDLNYVRVQVVLGVLQMLVFLGISYANLYTNLLDHYYGLQNAFLVIFVCFISNSQSYVEHKVAHFGAFLSWIFVNFVVDFLFLGVLTFILSIYM